jgi:hypothetical protein
MALYLQGFLQACVPPLSNTDGAKIEGKVFHVIYQVAKQGPLFRLSGRVI